MHHALSTRSLRGLASCATLFAIVVAGLLYGQDPQAKEINALIEQLGADSFNQRETASRALENLGEPILPVLRQAQKSYRDDLEVRERVRGAIHNILLAGCESKSTGLQLTIIHPGTFEMGSPEAETGRRDDEKQHNVSISETFLLGAYEVTQLEYQTVMKANSSAFSPRGANQAKVADVITDRFPVESVTWYDAIAFCNQLSRDDGLEPYYELADLKREGASIIAAKASVVGGRGYRLPTEAEWEYACRADTQTPFHFGGNSNGRQANCVSVVAVGGYGGGGTQKVELGRTARIGSYPANRWGLYDMHGNVAEWCWDSYDMAYYADSPRVDPRGPKPGPHRVLRGGSWLVADDSCRSASRFWQTPDERKDFAGFRIARTP